MLTAPALLGVTLCLKIKVLHPTPRDINASILGLGPQVAQSQHGKAFVSIYPSLIHAFFLQQGVYLLSEGSKAGDLGWNQGSSLTVSEKGKRGQDN